MKKVLMVAYAFPPVGGAGVQRIVKFIKYLNEFCWSADAVSVQNPSVPLVDDSLRRELPSDCTVFRSKTFEPSYAVKSSVKNSSDGKMSLKSWLVDSAKKCANSILLPDAQLLWWPHTFFLIRKLLKGRSYSVIFVSGPPFSTFPLVVFVAKLHGIPAIVDYRDEWSFSRDNWENSAKTPLARLIDSWMENYVVRNAMAITVASPEYELSLKDRFPAADGKIITITNGYDPADFAGIDFFQEKDNKDGSVTILYTGTVWRATSFQGLLEGIRILAHADLAASKKLVLRIVGRIVPEELPVIAEMQHYIHVETIDYLPHTEIFKEMAAADVLLLTLSDLPGAGKIIPGKTFEYLAAPLPVLAIVPNGVTADIVRNEKNVSTALPGDHNSICNFLRNILNEPPKRESREGIEKYSRPHLTQTLVELFNLIGK